MSLSDAKKLPGLKLDGGDLTFSEPWQAQAFALALQLHASGAFSWAEWTAALAEQLKLSDSADDGSRYYECWLEALERLVAGKALVTPAAIEERMEAWAVAYRHTPHGKPVEL